MLNIMSKSIQCEAIVTDTHRRCKRRTNRGIYCTAHQERNLGLVVTKSQIPEANLGLYTTKPLKVGDKIAEYTGPVTATDPPGNGRYVYQINSHAFIDAEDPHERGYARWINAALPRNRPLTNNAKFYWDRRHHELWAKATKNIASGSEIFAPYGAAYWRAIRAEFKRLAAGQ